MVYSSYKMFLKLECCSKGMSQSQSFIHYVVDKKVKLTFPRGQRHFTELAGRSAKSWSLAPQEEGLTNGPDTINLPPSFVFHRQALP